MITAELPVLEPSFASDSDAAPAAVPAPVAAAPAEVDLKGNTMVEISMSKLILGIAAAALVAGGSFFGFPILGKRSIIHKALPAGRWLFPYTEPEATKPARRSGKHYDRPARSLRHRHILLTKRRLLALDQPKKQFQPLKTIQMMVRCLTAWCRKRRLFRSAIRHRSILLMR